MTYTGGSMMVGEIMTPDPVILPGSASVLDAARVMRDKGIGAVLVADEHGKLCGILTDRDIAVRAVAEGLSPQETMVISICSSSLAVIPSTATVDDAIAMMRRKALRRLPVVDETQVIGIISLGDLALDRDRSSALADISAAPMNV